MSTTSSTCQRQQVFTEVTGLDKGIHKVKLVVKQGKISLDAFEFDAAVEATGLQITGADSLNMNARRHYSWKQCIHQKVQQVQEWIGL